MEKIYIVIFKDVFGIEINKAFYVKAKAQRYIDVLLADDSGLKPENFEIKTIDLI